MRKLHPDFVSQDHADLTWSCKYLTCILCYIPIFYFKLHPKFPFLFHTLMFPMFPTSSYSILRCFPILHSNVSNISHSLPTSFCTLMFSLLRCFQTPPVPFHALTFSNVFWCFPYFYRCGTFSELLWTHYHHGTFSVASWTHFPKHHNLRSIMDSIWMQ